MSEPLQPPKRSKRAPNAGNFKPGNRLGKNGRPAAMFSFAKHLRDFLGSTHPQAAEYNLKTGSMDVVKTQLDVIIRRLAKDDPKILLQYAYGKPIETMEIGGIEGAAVIKVKFGNFDPDAIP
jgi:hypothetical protein